MIHLRAFDPAGDFFRWIEGGGAPLAEEGVGYRVTLVPLWGQRESRRRPSDIAC
jgi:hypothetical protein